jgi:hypothetical protein
VHRALDHRRHLGGGAGDQLRVDRPDKEFSQLVGVAIRTAEGRVQLQ